MQVLQLILFAGLAAVVLFQLYSVLGRRIGRQPEDVAPAPAAGRDAAPALAEPAPEESGQLSGLAALRARDPSFEVGRFLHGAKQAYEMIVKAFASGDRQTLAGLLAPHVLQGFEAAIAEREAENRTEQVEFLQPPRADLESLAVEGDTARAVVRFLSEHRVRTKDAAGEAVDDRRTAELWTLERSLKTRDPNWTLVQVDAAEA